MTACGVDEVMIRNRKEWRNIRVTDPTSNDKGEGKSRRKDKLLLN